jgi:hypothetical protein
LPSCVVFHPVLHHIIIIIIIIIIIGVVNYVALVTLICVVPVSNFGWTLTVLNFLFLPQAFEIGAGIIPQTDTILFLPHFSQSLLLGYGETYSVC